MSPAEVRSHLETFMEPSNAGLAGEQGAPQPLSGQQPLLLPAPSAQSAAQSDPRDGFETSPSLVIGGLVNFTEGQLSGHTIRAQLLEIQKADRGRK